MVAAASAPLSAPIKFGNYELVHEIGHGGMAVVHRALFHGMGGFTRQVVIKRILPELASEAHFVRMFVEEARLSALLDHPNIVQIHDFGVLDNQYFIAMEHIEGIPLHRFIRHYSRARAVPPEAAAFIIHQVCVGLHYAHSLTRDGQPLGLVHRDVSPANIMLSSHGVVKLLDFGIAKAVDAIDREETRTGTLKGKWSYMAPEQVVGESATPRSDIFATGIVFWELCTGRRLFKAKTDYLTLSNVVQAKTPPVTAFRPELPQIFDTIAARALSRQPADRYRHAEEMADQLENYLAAHPFTTSKLAAMIEEVMSSEAEKPAPTEEEAEKTQPSTSQSAAPFQAVGTDNGSASASASNSLAAGEQAPIALVPRRSWALPATLIGVVVASLVGLTIYLVAQTDPGTGGVGVVATSAPKPALTNSVLPQRRLRREDPHSPEQQPPPRATPRLVRLRATSSPAGASVTVGDEPRPRGTTPLEIELARSGSETTLRLALAGHLPATRTIVPSQDLELSFTLKRKPAAISKVDPRRQVDTRRPRAPAERAEKQAPSVVEKRAPAEKKQKKVPNLKSGDLADPYQ
jgi:serine/threonine-protein kinase